MTSSASKSRARVKLSWGKRWWQRKSLVKGYWKEADSLGKSLYRFTIDSVKSDIFSLETDGKGETWIVPLRTESVDRRKTEFPQISSASLVIAKQVFYRQLWMTEREKTIVKPDLEIPKTLILPLIRREHLKWPSKVRPHSEYQRHKRLPLERVTRLRNEGTSVCVCYIFVDLVSVIDM